MPDQPGQTCHTGWLVQTDQPGRPDQTYQTGRQDSKDQTGWPVQIDQSGKDGQTIQDRMERPNRTGWKGQEGQDGQTCQDRTFRLNRTDRLLRTGQQTGKDRMDRPARTRRTDQPGQDRYSGKKRMDVLPKSCWTILFCQTVCSVLSFLTGLSCPSSPVPSVCRTKQDGLSGQYIMDKPDRTERIDLQDRTGRT